MKKSIIIILSIFILFLVSCEKDDTGELSLVETSVFTEPYLVSSYSEYGFSKAYIHNQQNVPILMLSSEIRLDLLILADTITIEDVKPYFEIASLSGINTLEIPIMWSMIEGIEGEYDFTEINMLLDYAVEYGLYLNFVWYGSSVGGESKTAYYPEYIDLDPEKYPLIADMYDFGALGRVKILDWTNDDLMEREALAVYSLMNNVSEWSKDNNNQYPLVMFQIGQGLDRFPRWRLNQYEVQSGGELMSTLEAWEIVNEYILAISRAVKYSEYRVITRVEFTEQNAIVNYVSDIKDIEYVDLVSPTYLHTISNVKSGIRNFQESFGDMPIYNAQNWANDEVDRNLLATIALGAMGFVSYELSAAQYYPEPQDGTLFNRIDPEATSIEDMFVQKNTRVSDLKLIIEGLEKAYIDVVQTPRQNFAVLGMDNRLDTGDTQFIYTSSGVMFNYVLAEDALGFVIVRDGYLLVFSTVDSTINFSNVTFITAIEGHYNNYGEFENMGVKELTNNNLSLIMEANILYRLRIASIDSLPTQISTEYISIYEAIR